MTGDGCFYKRSPPTAAGDSWLNSATKIGTAGWASFKFLFFGPQGDLYAVNPDGSFIKGPPPTYAQDDWRARSVKIGTAGWASFKFLFFGMDGDLYAVKQDGTFSRVHLPL